VNIRNISVGVDFWNIKLEMRVQVKIRKCIGKISCDVKKLIILKEYDLAVLKSLYGGM
jgi:hypothetical protein